MSHESIWTGYTLSMHCHTFINTLIYLYRRFFKDMQQVALDKKSNMEYLEKEIGLKRFLPKSIIENLKVGILKV